MAENSATAKQPELTPLTLWIMTVATGLIVANLYYNQPLLEDMAHTFNVSRATVGRVSMLPQLGYAAGMVFLAPLADMIRRKRMMIVLFVFIVASLLLAASASNVHV